MNAIFKEIRFSDDDVVNPGDIVAAGDYNPHKVRAFLLHDHGFVLAVVFADCLQDALDIAADNGNLDSFRVSEDDLGGREPGEGGLTYLGNDSSVFDIEAVGALELPNPRFSFVALFNASQRS